MPLLRAARVTKIAHRADTAAVTEVVAISAVVVDAAAAVIFAAIAEAAAASGDQAAISRLQNMLRLALTKKVRPSPLRPRATYP
jgi:hypothetical protein